ncbi:3-hydroxyisobutyryl-coenzyme A hydrolase, putative [Plasmodium ovale wallikeri]|uniref:3-hydroxyisobutyryl-CoA hydrolase n=1 Tax=Plasmodium ovale wallikeri TaxID=864142 RepID=A0A1A9A1T0_PLAOA|nr:3-hydroxyisobutyryl-coenzyme A hydrolase, putative [Plasmodium ovale wallikeri]
MLKGSLSHMKESHLEKAFRCMTKLYKCYPLFRRFLFFSSKNNQGEKKLSHFALCQKRHKNSLYIPTNLRFYVEGKNENFLEIMDKKNNVHPLVKRNISHEKKSNDFVEEVGDDILSHKPFDQTNISSEKKNCKKGEKEDEEKKDKFGDSIDLALSDVWSKKTLTVNYKNNVFEIILNRPEKLNAINKDMINGLLNMIKSLNNDERCNLIVIRSANTSFFCSGSDVKDIVQNKEKGMQHLKQLYMYINYLSKMKKNVLCIWNGYTMGGGLGISMYAKYKVINKNAIFAMPENKIGFFPDISSCYFFKKYFGRNIGLHLGLTSLRLNEADLVKFKICDNYIEDIDTFLNELYNINTINGPDFDTEFRKILRKYPPKVNTTTNPVLTEELISNINKYYNSANNLEELMNNLIKDDNYFCKKLLADIKGNCLFSCKLWFSYFLYNYDKSLEQILDNDFKITQYFLYHTKTFEKGVTELLVNKNKNFQWENDEESSKGLRGRNIYVKVRPISNLDDQSDMRLKKRDGKKGGTIYQKWDYERVYANGQKRELVALKKKKKKKKLPCIYVRSKRGGVD